MTRPAPFTSDTYDLTAPEDRATVIARLVAAAPLADTVGALLAGMDPWKRVGRTAEVMAERLRKDDPGAHRFAVMTPDAELLGAVIVRHPFLKGPYLEMLGLVSDARRRGIGRGVIDWMGANISGDERNLWLCVSRWNSPARRFYERVGFVEIGIIPDLVVPGTDEVFMRKTISPPA
ncbi:MAG: GNAT family N-acetyltransferase [Ancalomicrobiaceae bacterium]|nr:GNAT family N-acetyltransferase [Ancalomicrobiaceae bacterium]